MDRAAAEWNIQIENGRFDVDTSLISFKTGRKVENLIHLRLPFVWYPAYVLNGLLLESLQIYQECPFLKGQLNTIGTINLVKEV